MISVLKQKLTKPLFFPEKWIYLFVPLVMGMIYLNYIGSSSWKDYLFFLSKIALLYLPLILAYRFKDFIQKRLNNWRYYLFLCLVFAGNMLAVLYLTQSQEVSVSSEDSDFIVLSGIGMFLLILMIGMIEKGLGKFFLFRWRPVLNLEKALLIIALMWSVTLAMMGASNIDTFHEEHLIVTKIDFRQVFIHFGFFSGLVLQFFLVSMGYYFFYFINHRLLIPFILKKRGVLIYVLSAVGSVVLFYPLIAQLVLLLPLNEALSPLIPSENYNVFDAINGLAALAVIVISLPLILVVQWFEQNQAITMLEKQKAETELNLLKQQLNPHFFFNTLNNLYALSLQKSERTPEVILQLSELMRYVIYEGKEKQVELKKEVNYLQKYIELQRIRMRKELDLKFETQLADESLQIPPLLLITFIENAFKHGIEPAEERSFLYIRLESKKDKLHFRCENSFETENEKEGIGLENMKRRLELLFPNRHKLSVEKQKGIFKANLILYAE